MWTGPSSQFWVSPSFSGASQHPINIGAPSPIFIDVPNPASTTSSVIFTAIAVDNQQINACARTMDIKRGSELDDALKQHAQNVVDRATDDLRAKVGSDLHMLNQSMQGALDSTVAEIVSAMKQLRRCGAAASRRARGLPALR